MTRIHRRYNPTLRIDPFPFNTRDFREYSISPNYHYSPVHIRAQWIGGGRHTSYGVTVYRGHELVTDMSSGQRNMAAVLATAAAYFAANMVELAS